MDRKCFTDAATASFGFSTKKHQDWFDSNNASIVQLFSEKMLLMLPSFKIRHPLHSEFGAAYRPTSVAYW